MLWVTLTSPCSVLCPVVKGSDRHTGSESYVTKYLSAKGLYSALPRVHDNTLRPTLHHGTSSVTKHFEPRQLNHLVFLLMSRVALQVAKIRLWGCNPMWNSTDKLQSAWVVHFTTFAQRRNRLKALFSERIPVVKRRMTVYFLHLSTSWGQLRSYLNKK